MVEQTKMKEIVSIDIYYRKDKDAPLEQENASPVSQDIRAIKLQIGNLLNAIPYDFFIYYCVIGAMRNDGKVGFRTIIPRTPVQR
jgi:hypothetical protein